MERTEGIRSIAFRRMLIIGRRGRVEAIRAFYALDEKFYTVRVYSDMHKKALLGGFFSACFIVVTAFVISNNVTAYEYSYQGKVLGIVRDREQVYETVALVKDKLNAENGAEIIIDDEEDIEFTKVIVAGPSAVETLDTKEDVLDNLTYLKEVRVKGYVLEADDAEIGVFSNPDDANAILDEVKSHYLKDRDPSEFKEISFLEAVNISETETMSENIDDPRDVLAEVMKGFIEAKIYTVKAGDTVSGIAQAHGVTIEEMQRLNPDLDQDLVHEGEEIQMEEQRSLINLLTTETAIYEESFPFETIYEDSNNYYEGELIEKVAGVNGLRKVTADIAKVNGSEINREILDFEILEEPVSAQVLRGTKELPPLIGLGYFIRPASGSVTSNFGPRWGRTHMGIDIGVRYAPVYAADGGKVVFAGNRGDGLGNTIRIDHGGGRLTVYAHLSKISVSVGQSVFQGQRIATSGNSGNTTGPHLHFEVHINGVPKNPMNYL
ncbi:MAG: M23 family metallopeptidase [Clostridiales Family XIII bacterium]|nr:M23 family metallopeptidase [Clostridiales Family XIII bacterium]